MALLRYFQKTVPELKEILRDLGAPVSGRKQELLARIELWQENGLARKLVKPVEVSVCDPVIFPAELDSLEFCDITKFKSVTLESIGFWFSDRQARASMEKGRKLFLSKFMKCCSASIQEDKLFLKCFCAAETSKSTDYTVHVVIMSDGTVKQGSCSCVAGVGLSAACKHIGALLYCFEHYVGSNVLHQLISKTSQLQDWHRPPAAGRKVEPKTANQLTSNEIFGPNGVGMKYSPTIHDFCNLAINNKANCMFVKENRSSAGSSLYTEHDYVEIDLEVQRINDVNHLTTKERRILEKKTRKQANTKLWWKARKTRITGSKIYSVVSTVRSGRFSTVPAKSILQPVSFSNKATKWGKENEHKAIRQYELVTGKKVSACGLYVHPETEYIASSPDGITEDSLIVLEVKCPYNLRDSLPTTAKYLTYNNGAYSLKRNHPYFFQIQNHMYCTGIEVCDFVVWTPKSIFIEMIKFDEQFIVDMLVALKLYFERIFCKEAVKEKLFNF